MRSHNCYSDDDIAAILRDVRVVAMVGASANNARPSYLVLKYLLDKGYDVIPVNPSQANQEILGKRVYATLSQITRHVEMVEVFRPSSALSGIVDEVIRMVPRPRVIWAQLNVRDDEAAMRAEAAGIKVIMDRCPKIEFERLSTKIEF